MFTFYCCQSQQYLLLALSKLVCSVRNKRLEQCAHLTIDGSKFLWVRFIVSNPLIIIAITVHILLPPKPTIVATSPQ